MERGRNLTGGSGVSLMTSISDVIQESPFLLFVPLRLFRFYQSTSFTTSSSSENRPPSFF